GPINAECADATAYEALVVDEGEGSPSYTILAEGQRGWAARLKEIQTVEKKAVSPNDMPLDSAKHHAPDATVRTEEEPAEVIQLHDSMTSHDFVVAHLPEAYLNLEKVIEFTSYVYDCRGYKNALNEFQKQRLYEKWMPELKKAVRGETGRLGERYAVRIELYHEEYDFASKSLPIKPFGAQRVSLPHSPSCHGRLVFIGRDSIPHMEISLGEHPFLSSLPISPNTAEKLLRKNRGMRGMTVEVEFTPAGKAKEDHRSRRRAPVLNIDITKLTFLDRNGEMVVYALSQSEVADLKAAAEAEILLASFIEKTSGDASDMHSQLKRFMRHPSRFHRITSVFTASNKGPEHPLVASVTRVDDQLFGALVQAGDGKGEEVPVRWPARMVLDDSKAGTEFEDGRWYFVRGWPERLTGDQRGTALLRASIVYTCQKDACAEFDEIDWLYKKRLEEAVSPPQIADARVAKHFIRKLGKHIGTGDAADAAKDSVAEFRVPDSDVISKAILTAVHQEMVAAAPQD
ncbi:hypothetical protein ACSHT0_17230, partial [Tepidicaulis sp. LMO-SS28]|uniref:hypothetical protein n=1 Tax=Tepidicaulis sp. LMO-SS28 TaxID=3447455 RepID=UPI003EDF569F